MNNTSLNFIVTACGSYWLWTSILQLFIHDVITPQTQNYVSVGFAYIVIYHFFDLFKLFSTMKFMYLSLIDGACVGT